MPKTALKYKRILLKVSGEIFDSSKALESFVLEMRALQKLGVKIGIVVGGGNIWRFRDHANLKLDRVTSDTMGMVATIINALALVGALKAGGVAAVGMSALRCEKAIENYEVKKA
ncbi:MAG: UMP kinase, partial [Candidatus Gracilibacteria bacterium]